MGQMRLNNGSEFQLLRYLGHHRSYIDNEIKKVIGSNKEIKWMDYPLSQTTHKDFEWTGVQCFENLQNFKDIEEKWKEYWPQTGRKQSWDGIFKQEDIWYFVEAKAHIDEENSATKAKSSSSILKQIKAFEETCGNKEVAQKWQQSSHFQIANRLAFIHFCETFQIEARVLLIGFINGWPDDQKNNVDNKDKWENYWDYVEKELNLQDNLKNKIYHLTIDCNKALDKPNI